MTVLNTTTKKLIWPKYHVWYANTPKLRNLIGSSAIHIVNVDRTHDSVKTIAISNTKVNNYKFAIIDARTKRTVSVISGTINDINGGFVHVNKKPKFDSATITNAIGKIVSMLAVERIDDDRLAKRGKSITVGKNVTLDQVINAQLIAMCVHIATSLIRLISTNNGYRIIDNSNKSNIISKLFGHYKDVMFYIVSDRYVNTNMITDDKSVINAFNDKSIVDAIINLRFATRDVIAVKVAKTITRNLAEAVVDNITRKAMPPKVTQSSNVHVNISQQFTSADITLNSNVLTIVSTNNKLIGTLMYNRRKVGISPTCFAAVAHNTGQTMLTSYVDHLDVMSADCQPIYKTFANNVRVNGTMATIEQLVDKYPDIKDSQDKIDGFKLIRTLSAIAKTIDRFGVDIVFEYMYNYCTAVERNHIVIS